MTKSTDQEPKKNEKNAGDQMDNNAWTSKIWGRTRCDIELPNYHKHTLEIVKGCFCSFHFHVHRQNSFTLIDGMVRVVYAHGWVLHACDLRAKSDGGVIPAQIPHQFQVLESGVLLEEYWPACPGDRDVKRDDIIRLTEGGKGFQFDDRIGIVLADGRLWQGDIVCNAPFAGGVKHDYS